MGINTPIVSLVGGNQLLQNLSSTNWNAMDLHYSLSNTCFTLCLKMLTYRYSG